MEMPPATDKGRSATEFVTRHPLVLTCLLHRLDAPGLDRRDPWKPDEAYSFGLVYHIPQSGDWVIPTLAQEPHGEAAALLSHGAACTRLRLAVADSRRGASSHRVLHGLAFLFIGLAGELYQQKGDNGLRLHRDVLAHCSAASACSSAGIS
jgi:hypothetical protein